MARFDIDTVLEENRAAVGALVAAADRAAGVWTTPRAPGKWSPSQLIEHVALALEESANVVDGVPSKFPKLPVFLRPVIRGVFLNRIIKSGKFPNARTSPAMNPATGPATPAEGRVRLEAAAAKFDRACRARAGQVIRSTIFGAVPVEHYVRFQALHTAHHIKQMPGAR